MTTEGKLGTRIRKYREKLGLTQEQLALNAGLKPEFLDDVENDRVYPPIGTIIRLSRALGQRVGTFMDDQYLPDPIIMRREGLHEETDSSRGAKGHYHYFPLGSGKTDRHMEPLLYLWHHTTTVGCLTLHGVSLFLPTFRTMGFLVWSQLQICCPVVRLHVHIWVSEIVGPTDAWARLCCL